jgi:lantibiotic biosynthesis protein
MNSQQSFLHVIRKRDEAMLVEMYPPPESLCVRGPEGRFVHEIVVPFVRKTPVPDTGRAPLTADSVKAITRTFPPGSEWLYTKLYTGTATSDHVLSDSVAPLAQNLLESGAADRWFFIRYTDPDHHLRIRFHGDPQRLQNEVLPAIHAVLHPLLKNGQIRRIQFDTYEREVERYGGPQGIAIAEQIFQIDSDSVLEILDLLEGDEGTDMRWRITLSGIHTILNDFGFDLQQKHAVMKKVREQFGKEFRADQNLRKQLAERFRKERAQLQSLLNGDAGTDATDVLQRRSEALVPLIAQLRQTQNSMEDLAPSFIHMHVNRMLRAAQRQHELVLYDFLLQLYSSQIERARPKTIP